MVSTHDYLNPKPRSVEGLLPLTDALLMVADRPKGQLRKLINRYVSDQRKEWPAYANVMLKTFEQAETDVKLSAKLLQYISSTGALDLFVGDPLRNKAFVIYPVKLEFNFLRAFFNQEIFQTCRFDVNERLIKPNSLEDECINKPLYVDKSGLDACISKKKKGVSLTKTVIEKSRGRPSGSGSYIVLDSKLLDEMHQLIITGEATSPTNAASKISDRIPGGGTVESKIQRLSRAYKKRSRKSP